ncbi:hypothetical protein TNCV_4786821 [Trichonephila clavipes]|nr:hypothetical protein TNCV_4786821 [Trichonephila clavipes]
MNETTQQEKTTSTQQQERTTQLGSRNEQLNSAAGNETLHCRRPPATAYNRLQPPTTACNRLQPPAPPLQQNRLFLPTPALQLFGFVQHEHRFPER